MDILEPLELLWMEEREQLEKQWEENLLTKLPRSVTMEVFIMPSFEFELLIVFVIK